jgi:hypothetical protein
MDTVYIKSLASGDNMKNNNHDPYKNDPPKKGDLYIILTLLLCVLALFVIFIVVLALAR